MDQDGRDELIDGEPETEDLGLYHLQVEHDGLPGFICKIETSGGFIPSHEDVGFGLVSPIDAEWCNPSYYSQDHLIDDILMRWVESPFCGCEIRRLNVVANGEFDEGMPFECEPAPALKKLTLIAPNGVRIVLYDSAEKGDA